MNLSVVSEKDIFNCIAAHPGIKKLRPLFDDLFGHPQWWICPPKAAGNWRSMKKSLARSYEVWGDPRIFKFRYWKPLCFTLKKHSRETKAFRLKRKGTIHFIVPLMLEGGHVVGYLGMTGLKKDLSSRMLAILADQAQLVTETCSKMEELGRLSATIRPRAIALSTVHTVHRIINSTLNLDELVSRLAHLITQVLRASRCTIYLVEKPAGGGLGPNKTKKKPSALLCKALVGYPKSHRRNMRIPFGAGLEGHVAKTANIILRKKLLCIPLIDEDVIGVVTVFNKKDKKEFGYFDQEILTTLAEEAVIAIKNAQLYEEQKKVTLGTIQSLAMILGSRVPHTVSPEISLRLALRLAREMRLDEEKTQALHYATLLKETATISIPEQILKKPTKLTGKEYRLLRNHPIHGARIVQSFQSLKPVVPIILYSREKFDGSGYPKGLRGEKIPIGARILSVINAFEAIVMGRPYRGRSSLKEGLGEIMRNSGTQFDPKVVEAFVRIVQKEGPRLMKTSGKGERRSPVPWRNS